MEQNEMTMGKRIAARRKALKMTQDALAQELGVSAQAVSKWENDLSCPDISILPKLAKLLGVTTDALLGAEPEPTVHEAEIVPEDGDGDRPGFTLESDGGSKFDIQFNAPRRISFSGAAWLICTGLLMLVGPVLKINETNAIGFWGAVWISALLVWGVGGMLRRIRLSNVVATLGGAYFALEGLGIIALDLGWEIVFPVLILLLGVSMLIDGIRKKNRKTETIHISAPESGVASAMRMEDGVLEYNNAFSDSTTPIRTPVLKSGTINVSYGDHTLDFSGVEQVAEDCTVTFNGSFGDTCLRIPRRFRVNFITSKNCSEVNVIGHPDITPEGTINLVGNLSFGQLTIEYI